MEAETNKLRPLELGKAFEFDLTNNTLTPVKSMFEDDNSINNTVTAADRMNQYIDKCESRKLVLPVKKPLESAGECSVLAGEL